MAELLAPAGNIEALDAAIGEGADAVYLGLKSFNARLRTTNFAWNQFEAAVNSVHKLGKKIFVTVNTVLEAGNGNLFQYSCLGNSMNRGVWQAIVHGVEQSHT